MKLLLISDIHSNIHALDAVLEAERDSDFIYCTGDLVDVGFHPQEVVNRVREKGIICVQGNHDLHVIHKHEEGWDDRTRPENFRDLNARQLDAGAIGFLKQLPQRLYFAHDGVSYLLEHLYRGYELIRTMVEFDAFWGDRSMAEGTGRRAIILGHTHHPGIFWMRDDACWINPGSVGYNRPGDPSIATRYITVTDGKARIHHLHHAHTRSRVEIGEEFKRRFGGE
ncbi:MAG: metallophosphoesterase family protein [Opitutales bacterium]|nr:metallophosphoesterase family protein [Opitutales bacterium]